MNNLANTIPRSANSLHLKHLFILRFFFIIVQFSAILISIFFIHLSFPLMPVLIEAFCLILFNVYVGFRLNQSREVLDNEIFRHLIIDIAALSVVLYFTGGASNPFITLFIVPLIISVIVLPARYAWIFAATTLTAYSILMFQYVPLEMMPHAAHQINKEFGLHIIGMWTAFAFSAGLISHFAVKMGNTIRMQDKMLTKAKEDALRDQQIIELGTLAASTAHELGTPLGTMNLLISELRNELAHPSEQVAKDLASLKKQIDQCKNALSNLSLSAGAMNVSSGGVMSVSHYLSDILQEWKNVRGDINIKTQWDKSTESALVLADRTLTQAMINILDNAADASPQDIEWRAQWNDQTLLMEISDRGNGLINDENRQIGKTSISQTEKGLGLGLFLSHAIIERFGGSVSLKNRKGGGMITRISIPLLSDH